MYEFENDYLQFWAISKDGKEIIQYYGKDVEKYTEELEAI